MRFMPLTFTAPTWNLDHLLPAVASTAASAAPTMTLSPPIPMRRYASVALSGAITPTMRATANAAIWTITPLSMALTGVGASLWADGSQRRPNGKMPTFMLNPMAYIAASNTRSDAASDSNAEALSTKPPVAEFWKSMPTRIIRAPMTLIMKKRTAAFVADCRRVKRMRMPPAMVLASKQAYMISMLKEEAITIRDARKRL